MISLANLVDGRNGGCNTANSDVDSPGIVAQSDDRHNIFCAQSCGLRTALSPYGT